MTITNGNKSQSQGPLLTIHKLIQERYSNAINYSIDIVCNTITKASFSFPEVIALLHRVDIKINGWSNKVINGY